MISIINTLLLTQSTIRNGLPNTYHTPLPLSGSELTFNPYLWSLNPYAFNSYEYAINKNSDDLYCSLNGDCYYQNSQPGYNCTPPFIHTEDYCLNYEKLIECDNSKNIYKVFDKYTPCLTGYYKIGFALAINSNNTVDDSIFYRQDNDTFWSHKRMDIIRFDSTLLSIVDPELSGRYYSNYFGLNYNNWCGYYCISL